MKVLVVDDELIMREAFLRLFNWEDYDLEQVGQASNGLEALEFIKNNEVDIVITDLKMPIMDGLELISQAKEVKPELRFVVMSAYDNFELVKKAYKQGINDYFLKINMEAEEVLKVLSKLANEIKEERLAVCAMEEQEKQVLQRREKLKHIEAIMTEHEQGIREQLLKKMFWNKLADLTVIDNLRAIGVSIPQYNLRVMTLNIENYYEIERQNWVGERELLKFGILNLMEEIIRESEQIFGFCNLPHEYIFIYSEENIDKSREFINNFFETIKSHLEQIFGFSVSGGLSEKMHDYKNCQKMYQQACYAETFKFIRGKGLLILHEECRSAFSLKEDIFKIKAEKFKELLSAVKEPKQILTGITNYRIDGNHILPEHEKQIRELFRIYHYELLGYITRSRLSDRGELNARMDDFANNLKEQGTLHELNEWLKSILELLAREMEKMSIVSMAQHYIRGNYSQNISLADVAEHLGISESYLSRIFKKETGESFSNYVRSVRIEIAVSLMKNPVYKVYEIADMVGYKNVEYFSREFKKVTGKSPKEF